MAHTQMDEHGWLWPHLCAIYAYRLKALRQLVISLGRQ